MLNSSISDEKQACDTCDVDFVNVIHLDNHVETHEKNISVTNLSEAECAIFVHECESDEFILHKLLLCFLTEIWI